MDNKLTNIKERILYIVKNQGFKYEDFFDKIGMSYGNFKGSNKNRPINSDAIADILTFIPQLNTEWLITGQGSMLKSEPQSAVSFSQPQENDNNEIVSLLKDKISLLEKNNALLEKENAYQAKEILLLEKEVSNLKKQTKSPTPAKVLQSQGV